MIQSKLEVGQKVNVPNAIKTAKIVSFKTDGTIDKVEFEGKVEDYISLIYRYRNEIRSIISWIIGLFNK